MRCGDSADRQPEAGRFGEHPAGSRVSEAPADARGDRGGVSARQRSASDRRRHSSARRRSGSAAGIPSVLIGNFTWDWIYEGYRDDAAPELARDIRRLYRDATVALRLPMAGGFAGLESITRDIPFIARRSRRTQDEVRAALGLAAARKRQTSGPDVVRGARHCRPRHFGSGRQKDYTIATTDLPAADDAAGPAIRAVAHLRRAGVRQRTSLRGSRARRRCRRDQAGLRHHQRSDCQRRRAALHLARPLRRIRRARQRNAEVSTGEVYRAGRSAEWRLERGAGTIAELSRRRPTSPH